MNLQKQSLGPSKVSKTDSEIKEVGSQTDESISHSPLQNIKIPTST